MSQFRDHVLDIFGNIFESNITYKDGDTIIMDAAPIGWQKETITTPSPSELVNKASNKWKSVQGSGDARERAQYKGPSSKNSRSLCMASNLDMQRLINPQNWEIRALVVILERFLVLRED